MSLSEQEKKTIKAYGRIASERRDSGYWDKEFWREEFDEFQKILPTGRILDLGCGVGRDSHLFLETGYEYVGIDLSETSLDIARMEYPEADFRVMDMYELSFADNSFDGFWAVGAFLHAPKSNVRLLLREARRVAKEGGLGFVVMQKGPAERMVGERFFAFYQLDEFAEILREVGFEVLDSYEGSKTSFRKKAAYGGGWLVYFVKNL